MSRVNDAVVNQRIVDIVDRNPDIRRIGHGRSIEFLLVDNDGFQDAGDSLFQDLISRLLEILVNRQIHVVAGLRLDDGTLVDFQDSPQIVDVDRLLSVAALQRRFHDFFNAGFADDGSACIFGVLRLEGRQFIRRDFAGVADNGGKGFGIRVDAVGIFHDIDARQLILLLLQLGDRIIRNFRGDGDRDIFLVAGRKKLIADVRDVQDFLLGQIRRKSDGGQFAVRVWLFGPLDGKTLFTDQIGHHGVRTGIGLFVGQVLDFCLAVYVGFETLKRRAGYVVAVVAVRVQDNMEIVPERIAVGQKDLLNLVGFGIQRQRFLPVGAVGTGIRNRQAVGKLVGRQDVAVAVIYVSPGAFQGQRLRCLHAEIVAVILPVDDLQVIQPADEDESKHDE